MTNNPLRAWLADDGLRVCRDVDGQPQHLAYISSAYGGTLIWEPHEEGGRVPVVGVLEADAV